jgi:hypothetical protein
VRDARLFSLPSGSQTRPFLDLDPRHLLAKLAVGAEYEGFALRDVARTFECELQIRQMRDDDRVGSMPGIAAACARRKGVASLKEGSS